jgi:hypothetical protein
LIVSCNPNGSSQSGHKIAYVLICWVPPMCRIALRRLAPATYLRWSNVRPLVTGPPLSLVGQARRMFSRLRA